jgi:hypothetical protein
VNAAFILTAIRAAYPSTAVVPELTIEDLDIPDSGQIVEHLHTHTALPEGQGYSRRIDALMFDSLVRTAIEIKVTRADFMRDTHWKRRAWQNVTHRFVYAVPEGLDVMTPHGIGLWKVSESGRVTIAKKAIVSKTPDPLPQTVIQRLAYRAAKIGPPA